MPPKKARASARSGDPPPNASVSGPPSARKRRLSDSNVNTVDAGPAKPSRTSKRAAAKKADDDDSYNNDHGSDTRTGRKYTHSTPSKTPANALSAIPNISKTPTDTTPSVPTASKNSTTGSTSTPETSEIPTTGSTSTQEIPTTHTDASSSTPETSNTSDEGSQAADGKPLEDEEKAGIDSSLPPISDIEHAFQDLISGKAKESVESLAKARGFQLRVATMCSGTDSPIFALDLINRAFVSRDPSHRSLLEIVHTFSVEISGWKAAFIRRNMNTTVFSDVRDLAGGSRRAYVPPRSRKIFLEEYH